jgi:probable rRNA maturation factor
LIRTAELTLQKVNCDDASINVCFVKDGTIKKLNKLHRGKDYATDVLSFDVPKGFPKCMGRYMGDIIISVDTAARNAKQDGRTLTTELQELLVHGILHLCGYDHEKVSKARSDKMFSLQKKIMKEVLSHKWKA